jgi:MFS family permease
VSGRQSYNLTLSALLVASVAYTLQQTMIVPALPALQHDLHTTTGWTTWLLSGFLLSASIGTPLLGKLGDQHGKERMLVISLVLFLAGCIGAAAAWNIWSLIAFRIVQGAAGGIFPLSFSIIRDEFPPERMAGAFGSISAV